MQQGPKRKHHPLNPEAHMVDPLSGKVKRGHMSRQASIATSAVLDTLPAFQLDLLAQRFIDLYRDPTAHVAYMESDEFCSDIMSLCGKAKMIFEREPRCLSLESPTYVFGDTHGNLEDLHFFSDNIWRLGLNLCAGRFLFLGDYVDRGMSSIEVVTYLIAMKILYPHKIFLLRGNHETRDVNGWEDHYGEKSFIAQCKDRFGEDRGEQVWEELNQVFDRLPLAAVIDRDIFCIHGGVPRPLPGSKPTDSRLEMLERIPRVLGINPPYEGRHITCPNHCTPRSNSPPTPPSDNECETLLIPRRLATSLRSRTAPPPPGRLLAPFTMSVWQVRTKNCARWRRSAFGRIRRARTRRKQES